MRFATRVLSLILMPGVLTAALHGQAAASGQAPKSYEVERTTTPITIDGKLDEPAWASAPWTTDFVDIEGAAKPDPRYRTRVKMLWDDQYLYIAAELEEPDVQAKLTQHDSVIFRDNDFEVFIKPLPATESYYEFEINALNTGWDLFLNKPYLKGGKADNSWDIPTLKTAVSVQGTLNQPGDQDKGWTLEIAYPWSAFRLRQPEMQPPSAGTTWRINFSRVEHLAGRPHEDNWVWSPQGVINMHVPEQWGYLHFKAARAGSPDAAGVPVDRLSEPAWAARHQAALEQVRQHPDTQLLLIGDSIFNNYDKAKLPDENFQPAWNQFYAPRKALNLGSSGDTTANAMWRIDHGEVEGLHPKAAVVLIGTNNTGHAGQSAEQTEVGIDALVGDLEQRLPGTRILLLGILPSDLSAKKTQRDAAVNEYLATCYGENPRVSYLDIGSIFFKQSMLNTAIFYDPRLPKPAGALHPDTNGQRMMAEAIEPTLARVMGEEPAIPLASMTAVDTATLPVSRLEIDSYDWFARHHAELALQKRVQPDVVLLGDSITHFWGGLPLANHVNGPASWQRAFGSMQAINMGFGWDRTQNVLWRLRQGEFAGLSPRFVILNIGTNNLVGSSNARAGTPEEVVTGIVAICDEVRRRSPQSRILVMAIFPRGHAAGNPLRARISQTNALLEKELAGRAEIQYLDIGSKFLDAEGNLPASLMPDGTHPSDTGYQIWADALAAAGVTP